MTRCIGLALERPGKTPAENLAEYFFKFIYLYFRERERGREREERENPKQAQQSVHRA